MLLFTWVKVTAEWQCRSLYVMIVGECGNKECPFLHIDPEKKIKVCPWYDRGFCRHGKCLFCLSFTFSYRIQFVGRTFEFVCLLQAKIYNLWAYSLWPWSNLRAVLGTAVMTSYLACYCYVMYCSLVSPVKYWLVEDRKSTVLASCTFVWMFKLTLGFITYPWCTWHFLSIMHIDVW